MIDKVIWITWERQIRNISISSHLGVKLFEIIISSSRPKRYIKSLIHTIITIITNKPTVVIVPNPSIILGYSLLFLRKIFRFSLVADAHFGGIMAFNGNNLFQKALNIYNSKADLVIVTNDNHAEFVRSLGGKAFVCQDPLPVLSRAKSIDGDFDKTVFFICSFDIDEPFMEFFEAASILKGKGFSFLVSGNYRKANIDPSRYQDIKFLDYIPDDEFYGYLKQCSVIVDLTIWDDCLVCGAYEALSAGKPLVLSDKPALKRYFAPAAVFTEHSPILIAQNIYYAYKHKALLGTNIEKWVEGNKVYMTSRIDLLRDELMGLNRYKK